MTTHTALLRSKRKPWYVCGCISAPPPVPKAPTSRPPPYQPRLLDKLKNGREGYIDHLFQEEWAWLQDHMVKQASLGNQFAWTHDFATADIKVLDQIKAALVAPTSGIPAAWITWHAHEDKEECYLAICLMAPEYSDV